MQVGKLIVGLYGAVCAKCVDLCCDVLHRPSPFEGMTDEEIDARGSYSLGETESESEWGGKVQLESGLRSRFQSEEEVNRFLTSFVLLMSSNPEIANRLTQPDGA